MLEKDFIINKIKYLFNELIDPIAEKTEKPRKKFLHQAVVAILLSGSLVVTEFGRWRIKYQALKIENFSTKNAGTYLKSKQG